MTLISSIPKRTWALIISSALLQIFIFPIAGPLSFLQASIAWVALVPLLIALLLPTRMENELRPLQAAIVGYICGILWYLGDCYWIYQTMYLYGGLPKPVAIGILLLFALYLGLYHALFAVTLNLAQGSLGVGAALIFAPAIWVSVELARSRITGFPWDLLGYSQINNLLLTRLAPIAGVMALSFVIVAINAALASFFLMKDKRKIWIAAVASVLAILLQLGSPVGKHPLGEATDQTAVMLQENIEVGAPGRASRPLAASDALQAFSQLSLQPANSLSLHRGQPPTILIWPEAPSHFFTSDRNFLASIGALARILNAPLIIGSIGIEPSNQNANGYYEYDSAALFDATGTSHGHYDKIHLVPWGEYVPFKQFFSFAQKLTEGVGNMDPGTERSVFTTAGHTYGTFICYESIFGDEVRHFTLNGAEVLVNISDDGWYGDTGAPWQHLNMTRMRAIENHRWLLLDTNTGITTAIDPQGRTLLEAPRHTRGAYAFPFAFTEGLTFYARFGDWFAWLCTVVSVAALLIATFRMKAGQRGAKPRRLGHATVPSNYPLN